MYDYMGLNRLTETRAVYQEAQARKLASGELDRARYLLAFLEGDQEMNDEACRCAGKTIADTLDCRIVDLVKEL